MWNVTYEPDAEKYPVGVYEVQVVVQNYLVFWYRTITSVRLYFQITDTVNGEFNLIQQNKTRENEFVASLEPLTFNVSVKETDWNFIKTAPTIATFWFIDCVYYGFSNNFSYVTNYTTAEEVHLVEALIVADFTPLPPPTTLPPSTTTTIKPTAAPTTTSPVTTTKPIKKPVNDTISLKHVRRSIPENNHNATSNIKVYKNGTLVPYEGYFPYVCNSTKIATDPQKSYGYFRKTFTVKSKCPECFVVHFLNLNFVLDPVRNVNITGNNWLQHGDLLSLNVQCVGSKPLKYCVNYQKGSFNVTGNETCEEYFSLDECQFPIQRYLAESMQHTIIIVIQNDVSKIVKSVTVTIYKGNNISR